MKLPKTVRRHCPFCRKHTEHKITEAKKKAKGATHPMSRGSKSRARARGEWRGTGNLGKYSKPPINKYKMTGKKRTKKIDLRFQCSECKKTHCKSQGFRIRKLELI